MKDSAMPYSVSKDSAMKDSAMPYSVSNGISMLNTHTILCAYSFLFFFHPALCICCASVVHLLCPVQRLPEVAAASSDYGRMAVPEGMQLPLLPK
jgi:hypothetical protein